MERFRNAIALPSETETQPLAFHEKQTVRPEKAPRTIPVLLPKLPSTDELLPFLRSIDAGRWYTNGGPLVTLLEREIAEYLDCGAERVVTVANATAGITAALLALDVTEGSFCIVPSWTFAATPHAARAAGLTPWFHDVDRRTWSLDPQQVKQTINESCAAARSVVVVSPFGAPIDLNGWQQFQADTGIPVVVDAAAGFDTVCASPLLSVVSLHATKVCAAGEGGFVVAGDRFMADRVRACSNFGFQGSRVASHYAINGKMSEYHAAVALASLKRWPAARLKHLEIMRCYRTAIERVNGVSLSPAYGNGWASGTTSVILPPGKAAQAAELLRDSGVETRSWWGTGCHVQPAFAKCLRGEVPVTEDLGERVVGLPHYPDLEAIDVAYIVNALARALRSLGQPAARMAPLWFDRKPA